MDSIQLTLKGKPISVNTLYATMCRGNFPNRYMTAKGKAQKEDYGYQVLQQVKKTKWKMTDKPLSVSIELYLPDKRKNDIDNFNKIIFDSLTGIVWNDDSQIQRLFITKEYDKENPRVELSVNIYG